MSISRKNTTDNKEWNTPPDLVEKVERFFDGEIELDPCSNKFSFVNAKQKYMLPEHNGLEIYWNAQKIFVNPPYGRDAERGTNIKNWIAKCSHANKMEGSQVIALIPVATNSKAWQQDIFINATAVCFLKVSRLKFWNKGIEHKKGAPMACCFVYWGDDYDKFEEHFKPLGKTINLNNERRKEKEEKKEE